MLFFGTQVWYKEACHRKPCNHLLLDQLPSVVERTVALVHVGCLFKCLRASHSIWYRNISWCKKTAATIQYVAMQVPIFWHPLPCRRMEGVSALSPVGCLQNTIPTSKTARLSFGGNRDASGCRVCGLWAPRLAGCFTKINPLQAISSSLPLIRVHQQKTLLRRFLVVESTGTYLKAEPHIHTLYTLYHNSGHSLCD